MRSLYDSRLLPALAEILKRIQSLRLDSTESALVRALDEEAEALLRIPPTKRRTKGAKDAAWEAACDSYARLIRLYLKCPEYRRALSPDDVLSFRCKATAWAIAAKILDAEKQEAADE